MTPPTTGCSPGSSCSGDRPGRTGVRRPVRHGRQRRVLPRPSARRPFQRPRPRRLVRRLRAGDVAGRSRLPQDRAARRDRMASRTRSPTTTTSPTSAPASTTCARLGVGPVLARSDSYVASQALAETLLEAGSLGVVYPSVRREGGTCLACFRPALVTNVRRGHTWKFTWKGGEGPRIMRVGAGPGRTVSR